MGDFAVPHATCISTNTVPPVLFTTWARGCGSSKCCEIRTWFVTSVPAGYVVATVIPPRDAIG
jgi:hypothetical protein